MPVAFDYGEHGRDYRPACEHEAAQVAYMRAGPTRGHCQVSPPAGVDPRGYGFRCAREPGHRGPHLATRAGGRTVMVKWYDARGAENA